MWRQDRPSLNLPALLNNNGQQQTSNPRTVGEMIASVFSTLASTMSTQRPIADYSSTSVGQLQPASYCLVQISGDRNGNQVRTVDESQIQCFAMGPLGVNPLNPMQVLQTTFGSNSGSTTTTTTTTSPLTKDRRAHV